MVNASADLRASQIAATPAALPGRDPVTAGAALASATALLGMMAIVCYEVLARRLFNAPTVWVTEVATYVFVAIVFLGLAVAQRAGSHIQVEVLIGRLAPRRREALELVALWLAFLFAAFTAWQMAVFNYQEYLNDTRDWGLLSTPQWIPQLPVTIGLVLFSYAILRDVHALRPPRRPAAHWGGVLAVGAMATALWWLGADRVPVGVTRIDWGSVALAAGALAAALAWSGPRTALCVAALAGGLALVFHLAADASMLATGVLLVGSLLLLLAMGVRVGIAMGVVGLLGLMFLLPRPQLAILADRSWSSINSFTLTAVPMFVLMGSLLIRSGIPARLFDALVCWFGRTSGGLAHSSVVAAAVFAAVSGSSLATAATLGQVAAPEMTRRGYSRRLTYGVVAAGATLGILIPPSIAMILYGNIVGVSITALFMAGLVPGLLLAGAFMLMVLAWSRLAPGATPRGERRPLGAKLSATKEVLPFAVLIAAVLGSLYAGIATPTEAGAVGAAVAMLLCAYRRKLTLAGLYESAVDTVRVTSFLMLIVIGAAVFGWVFDYLRLPRALVSLVTDADLAPWLVMLLVALVYVALGTVLEPISMMLMTLAVTFPVVTAVGIDPIWFGVVLVLLIEIGLVTPPVGIVLFVLRGLGDDVPLEDVVLGVAPFVTVMLLFVAALYAFPEVVTWLPDRMR